MHIVRATVMAWLTIGIAVLMPAVAGAQTYSTLFNCDSTVASPYASLIQGSDANFYGTASQGRSYGTVFKMTPAGSVTILHAFTNSDGASPYGALVLGSDGNFYGTTLQGGSHSDGTVFQLTTGGTLTTLYNFSGSADGAGPYGKLVQATDGNFYGVTAQGGSSGYGTVYKITSGGTLTTLHNFTAAKSDASTPRDGLIQASDGFLRNDFSRRRQWSGRCIQNQFRRYFYSSAQLWFNRRLYSLRRARSGNRREFLRHNV